MPEWQRVDRYPNTVANIRAYAAFKALDNLTPEDLNLDTQEGDIPALRFSAEAQEVFNTWHDQLEVRLRSGKGLVPAFESHIAKYRSLMPSLALLFHLVAVADGSAHGPVSEEAARLAADWCAYLEQHARKLYAPELRAPVAAAHALAAKIRNGSVVDGDTVSSISQRDWKGLDRSEVDQALEVLGESNWVRVETFIGPQGGRPSPVVRLHPDLVGGGE